MGQTARALVVDGSPLLREGLVLAVRRAIPGTEIDAAGSVAEAAAILRRRTGYRLAVIDPALPDARGLAALMILQRHLEHVPIAVFSADAGRDFADGARALGMAACLSTALSMDETVAALRRVAEGETIFPPAIAPPARIAAARLALDSLSDAQLRVVLALADGRSNKQIAIDLGVAEATIKSHFSAAFRKLGVYNRAQALIAIQPLVGEAAEPPPPAAYPTAAQGADGSRDKPE